VTHAFFKALLFLGSGSVIHGMEHGVLHTGKHIDPQNMLNMGGLRKRMPITAITFIIGGAALAGVPLISAGFWSKDEILADAFGHQHFAVFLVLAVAALMTAFYTMRQIMLTFFGEPRTEAARHAHETSWTMTLPLVVLAFFAVTAGWAGIPENFPLLGTWFPGVFNHFVGHTLAEPPGHLDFNFLPLLTSVVVSLGGLALGYVVYRSYQAGQDDPLKTVLRRFYPVLQNKYYLDEIYDFLFVRPAYWLSETFTFEWMDRGAIDGFLHGFAWIPARIGSFLRQYPDRFINWTGDATAEGVKLFGRRFRVIQSGNLQQYMLAALVVAFSTLFVYLYSLLR
jgi:NADH-quinone oxidoreductase subunit L